MKTTQCRKSMRWPSVALAGILLAAALAGCGGSAVTGDGTTAVTITIGGGGSSAAPATASPRATPRPLGATIPPTVARFRVTISGTGMDVIVQEFWRTGATMTVTLQVPSGPGRTILVEALDEGGVSHFRGVTVIDASGVALAVTIDMAIDPSNPALRGWIPFADTVSSPATLNRVAQGDGIVLAGGTSGEILSSTDGISWTSRSSGNISGNIAMLAFGDNTFLAMTSSFSSTFYPGSWTNRFFGATSDNVDDWTARGTIGTVGVPLAGIAFGGGTFVAVGDNNAFYSLDNGANWSPGTISGVSYPYDVAYGNGRFVAPAAVSDNVAVSTDGISWTTVAVGLIPPDTLRKIGFGGGRFLLTTSIGDVYTSADGVSWLQRTRFADISGSDTSVVRVAYGAGAFLIVTESPTQVFFSVDSGDTWIALDPFGTGGSYYLKDVLYWNGAYIGVGGDYIYPGFGHVFRSGDL
ncbi:MAG: hypothetical protein PHP88_10425 [bacterium]|nr:hypothetical protein [bacterium]